MNYLDRRREYITHNESLNQTPVILIAGERQTGKTEMVIDRMVRHAREGMRVAYIGHSFKYAQNTFLRIEDRQEPDVAKSMRSHGRESIDFLSGGSIRFLAASPNSLRGLYLDVLVWDDVQKPIPEDAFIAAKLIYNVVS